MDIIMWLVLVLLLLWLWLFLLLLSSSSHHHTMQCVIHFIDSISLNPMVAKNRVPKSFESNHLHYLAMLKMSFSVHPYLKWVITDKCDNLISVCAVYTTLPSMPSFLWAKRSRICSNTSHARDFFRKIAKGGQNRDFC